MSSIDNLERLLNSVRGRKAELLRNSSNYESSGKESDTAVDMSPQRKNRGCLKKRVRWQDKGFVASEHETDTDNDESCQVLDSCKPSAHSMNLQNNIRSLESRLSDLHKRCSSVKDPEVIRSFEHKASDVERSVLSTEVSGLKQQITALTNNLKALQLLTAPQVAKGQGKPPQKQTKVSVERESAFKILTAKGDKMNIDSSGDKTSVRFSNGDEMNVAKDNTVVSLLLTNR